MNALVIQPAFIGDAVISIALANAICSAEPNAEITYLVRPEAAGLLKYAPCISRVLQFDKYGTESGLKGIAAKADELNSYGFDIVFCLHNSPRSIALVKQLTAEIKVGVTKDHAFTNIVLQQKDDDAARRAARLAEAIFPTANIDALPSLEMPKNLLPKEFSELSRPIVGIAPGSVWSTKRWDPGHFLDLISKLILQKKSIVLLGLEKEIEPKLNNSLNILNNRVLGFISKLSLEESAAVIANLDLLISNDSAPVHIAVATGTKVIDIFGPTIPAFGFSPRPGNGFVIENKSLWCRPCTVHGSSECPIHTMECMKSISVEEVMAGVEYYS